MRVYEVWYLWRTEYLWRDGIWREERPPYREIARRGGWSTERPPYREVGRRYVSKWVALSSPYAVGLEENGQTFAGKKVMQVDPQQSEAEKLSHARRVLVNGQELDFMVLRNRETGEQVHVWVKHVGYGVSVGPGQYVLR